MSLEAGSIAEGTVTKLTHYGIFVSLPDNESGLVHISEIAEAFVRDVADYFQVGDSVKVKVLNIDDRGRYELSAKQAEAREPINPDAPTAPRRRVRRSTPQFEDRLSSFMKRSDRRISELKRNRDARRRGKRRR
ncbi:MAG: S1 RNA-binding domain-containing protein [Armatimonadota bacterium]|jgi:S1 RNA binding domain protein